MLRRLIWEKKIRNKIVSSKIGYKITNQKALIVIYIYIFP